MPSWFDRFGQEWATTGLTDDPTYAQADAGWAFIGQAPPTVEQFNSMFQWSDDKDNWLYGQIGNVIASANMLPDPNDLTQLLRAITSKLKIKLNAPYTIWVDSINGNDNNLIPNQGTPFRTIQHAMDWALETIEPAHNWVFIQLQPGTYEPATLQVTWNGGILIQGDILNPRSYLIKNTNGSALTAAYSAWFAVQGVSLEAVGADIDYETNGTGLSGVNAGIIIFKDIACGPCSQAQFGAWTAGQVYSWGTINYSIYANARMHIMSWNSGIVTSVRTHITIQNNPLFSLCFAGGSLGGYVQTWGLTFTGTARGIKGYADAYAIHNCGGVSPDVLYPGDTPSVTYRGGLYV